MDGAVVLLQLHRILPVDLRTYSLSVNFGAAGEIPHHLLLEQRVVGVHWAVLGIQQFLLDVAPAFA